MRRTGRLHFRGRLRAQRRYQYSAHRLLAAWQAVVLPALQAAWAFSYDQPAKAAGSYGCTHADSSMTATKAMAVRATRIGSISFQLHGDAATTVVRVAAYGAEIGGSSGG